ncbi:methyltransferase, type 11 [Desulfococcus multivorans]|nr:methyltransferase, type 11 [Desulfococcus multivorans]
MAETVRRPDTMTVGTDINGKDLLDARNRLAELDKIGEIRGLWRLGIADITALPFADAAFDLVICSEVLEHIPAHRAAVTELVRVLKPGGDLVISVPCYLPEKICWTLSKTYRSTPGGHIRIYSREAIQHLITASKVQLQGCHRAHSLHVPYWWLKCLLGLHRTDRLLVNTYHRFLVWDMMRHPKVTRFLEQLLNVVMGKSLVVYGRKSTLHPPSRQPSIPRHRLPSHLIG